MRFEIQLFSVLVVVGLLIKKFDWRGQFFLFLFIISWVFFNWKKG